VAPGSDARIYVDAYPERVFEASVERIADEAEFTPRDIHMPDERSSLVYEVVLRVIDPEGALKDGFPADAWIRWDDSEAWPDHAPW
jgi:HlyD family secretion protein